MPKTTWQFPDEKVWDKDWKATVELPKQHESATMKPVRAWMPYLIISSILIATRLPALGLKPIVQNWIISIPNLLGVQGVNYELQWAWLPGTVFILISFVTILLHKMTPQMVKSSWIATLKQTSGAAIAMIFGVALVQLMLNTSVNAQGLSSMMRTMANTLAGFFGGLYPVLAPFIGILGAFVSGSNTVSNMLFAPMQVESALMLQMSPIVIFALQCVGGGVGNMICVNNVVAACATVGVQNVEGKIIKRNFIPVLIYSALVIIIAYTLMAMGF